MENELASNYALALFELTKPNEYQAYLSAWELALSSLKEEGWLPFLASYSISQDEKYEAMDKVYSFPKAKEFLNFLKVVVSHHRVELLPEISQIYRSKVNDALGIKEGVLFSSVALEEKEVKKIEKAISKKLGYQVYLRTKVDHTLLGGVKVNIDGKVYDGTLRSRLQELKRSLKGGSR